MSRQRQTEKEKQRKRENLHVGEYQLQELVAFDFTVAQLSEFHFRINNRLDVWPSSKKWFDRQNFQKGEYGQLREFVKEHFAEIKNTNQAIGLLA